MSRFVGSLMDVDFPLTSLIVAADPPFTGKTTRQSNLPPLSAHAAHISQNHKARVPRRRLPAIDEAVNGAGTRERDGKSQVG